VGSIRKAFAAAARIFGIASFGAANQSFTTS
jgi:hypothetical protein